jgi:hypothetical protein
MPNSTWISGEPVSVALAASGAFPAGGMNGLQLAALTLTAPATMNSSTTASLMATITALNRELSFTPTIVMPVRASTIAPRQRAGDAGSHERQRDGGAGLGGGGDAGEHEDAGADDHPDAEDGQVPGRQVLAELVVRLLGVPDGLLDRLGAQQVHAMPTAQPPGVETGRVRPWQPDLVEAEEAP